MIKILNGLMSMLIVGLFLLSAVSPIVYAEDPITIIPDEIQEWNPSFLDADSDNDGLKDYEERDIGTNPYDSDTDDDFLDDYIEVQWGTDPHYPSTAAAFNRIDGLSKHPDNHYNHFARWTDLTWDSQSNDMILFDHLNDPEWIDEVPYQEGWILIFHNYLDYWYVKETESSMEFEEPIAIELYYNVYTGVIKSYVQIFDDHESEHFVKISARHDTKIGFTNFDPDNYIDWPIALKPIFPIGKEYDCIDTKSNTDHIEQSYDDLSYNSFMVYLGDASINIWYAFSFPILYMDNPSDLLFIEYIQGFSNTFYADGYEIGSLLGSFAGEGTASNHIERISYGADVGFSIGGPPPTIGFDLFSYGHETIDFDSKISLEGTFSGSYDGVIRLQGEFSNYQRKACYVIFSNPIIGQSNERNPDYFNVTYSHRLGVYRYEPWFDEISNYREGGPSTLWWKISQELPTGDNEGSISSILRAPTTIVEDPGTSIGPEDFTIEEVMLKLTFNPNYVKREVLEIEKIQCEGIVGLYDKPYNNDNAVGETSNSFDMNLIKRDDYNEFEFIFSGKPSSHVSCERSGSLCYMYLACDIDIPILTRIFWTETEHGYERINPTGETHVGDTHSIKLSIIDTFSDKIVIDYDYQGFNTIWEEYEYIFHIEELDLLKNLDQTNDEEIYLEFSIHSGGTSLDGKTPNGHWLIDNNDQYVTLNPPGKIIRPWGREDDIKLELWAWDDDGDERDYAGVLYNGDDEFLMFNNLHEDISETEYRTKIHDNYLGDGTRMKIQVEVNSRIQTSNSRPYTIRHDNGLTIYCTDQHVTIRPGQSIDVPITIINYNQDYVSPGREVRLTADIRPEDIYPFDCSDEIDWDYSFHEFTGNPSKNPEFVISRYDSIDGFIRIKSEFSDTHHRESETVGMTWVGNIASFFITAETISEWQDPSELGESDIIEIITEVVGYYDFSLEIEDDRKTTLISHVHPNDIQQTEVTYSIKLYHDGSVKDWFQFNPIIKSENGDNLWDLTWASTYLSSNPSQNGDVLKTIGDNAYIYGIPGHWYIVKFQVFIQTSVLMQNPNPIEVAPEIYNRLHEGAYVDVIIKSIGYDNDFRSQTLEHFGNDYYQYNVFKTKQIIETHTYMANYHHIVQIGDDYYVAIFEWSTERGGWVAQQVTQNGKPVYRLYDWAEGKYKENENGEPIWYVIDYTTETANQYSGDVLYYVDNVYDEFNNRATNLPGYVKIVGEEGEETIETVLIWGGSQIDEFVEFIEGQQGNPVQIAKIVFEEITSSGSGSISTALKLANQGIDHVIGEINDKFKMPKYGVKIIAEEETTYNLWHDLNGNNRWWEEIIFNDVWDEIEPSEDEFDGNQLGLDFNGLKITNKGNTFDSYRYFIHIKEGSQLIGDVVGDPIQIESCWLMLPSSIDIPMTNQDPQYGGSVVFSLRFHPGTIILDRDDQTDETETKFYGAMWGDVRGFGETWDIEVEMSDLYVVSMGSLMQNTVTEIENPIRTILNNMDDGTTSYDILDILASCVAVKNLRNVKKDHFYVSGDFNNDPAWEISIIETLGV